MKLGRSRRGRRTDDGGWTLFYSADFHGSDVCFKKFLNAARHFGADVLVAGGDLTGKLMIPIVETPDGWRVERMGKQVTCTSEEAVATVEKELRDRGTYPFRSDAAEVARVRADPEAQAALFDRLVQERLAQWREWAEERLDTTQLLLIPGNDDAWVVDEYLGEWGDRNIDGRAVQVRDLTVIGIGVSNETPFASFREFPEAEIAARIDSAAACAEGPLVFNIHVPPHGTKLDLCPRLDDELRPVVRGGNVDLIHAGSTAVRDAVERLQPVLSLHGHIHESPAIEQLGRTVAVNCGSEYGSGILRGALVSVRDGALERYQLTSG
jgi:uncharacterized protein